MIMDHFDHFYNRGKSRDFDKGKKYALCHNNHTQCNIRTHNQFFGYGNQTSFEMSEGQLNVSLFL